MIEALYRDYIILEAACIIKNTLYIDFIRFLPGVSRKTSYIFALTFTGSALTPGQLLVNSQTFTLHLYILLDMCISLHYTYIYR